MATEIVIPRSVHPGMLGHAWCNVANIVNLSSDPVMLLDSWGEDIGLWIVGASSSVVAASFVPYDPEYQRYPPLSIAPEGTERVRFTVGEVKRITSQFMKPKWDEWKKDPADAGFDDNIVIKMTKSDDDGAFPGMGTSIVRFSGPGEHLDARGVERVAYPWDAEMRTIRNGVKDGFALQIDVMAALGKIKGSYTKPTFGFGPSNRSFMELAPMEHYHPWFIAAVVTSSPPDDALRSEPTSLSVQEYDGDTDTYEDVDSFTGDTPDDRAEAIVRNVMADSD